MQVQLAIAKHMLDPHPCLGILPRVRISPSPQNKKQRDERCFFRMYLLVRTDDHSVLLVDEAVHFRPYLFDGGLHLLAVDEDGNASCAALCHKLMFWQIWFKRPSQVGTVRENAFVSFDCVFVFPNTATTIGMVTSGLPRSLNGKRARSPKVKKKHKKRGPESPL